MNKKLIEVARLAIAKHVAREETVTDSLVEVSPAITENPNGIFVTLWAPGGLLRGCIGRHHREYGKLEQEVADCAILSASEDPRFPPVSAEELPGLGIEISLLGAPEKIEDTSELDPKRYGVIIEAGNRRATLLPDIEGIDTVEQQTRIVRQKAGISPGAPVTWYRFEVRKVSE